VWDSQTCVLGWPVQGIWTPDKGLSDINAVDKHHAGTLLATADDFGSVNIYRYPCGNLYEQKCQRATTKIVSKREYHHLCC
jgi:hypothetical protein